jgi:uncharacterized alkaline shock family protein YloU
LAEPADRGRLEIDPTVVRKVAERAADLTEGTVRVPRRGLGSSLRGATARISGEGDQVDVRLDVALSYPAPVRDAVRELREQVTGEVARITGYRVRSVDVTVSALVPQRHDRVE